MTTPDQVLAALEVLGWPDDRNGSAHVEPDGHEVTPARHYWDLVTSVLDAAAAAYVPSLLPEGMTEDELIERFRQAMAEPQRITVLPPSESEREQAAYERGVAEGRRQATEGWNREWGVQSESGKVEIRRDERGGRRLAAFVAEAYTVVSRLVGPWEPAEQATPWAPLIRVVPGMPSDTLLFVGQRCDDECRRGECEHVHEVAVRLEAEQDGDGR